MYITSPNLLETDEIRMLSRILVPTMGKHWILAFLIRPSLIQVFQTRTDFLLCCTFKA